MPRSRPRPGTLAAFAEEVMASLGLGFKTAFGVPGPLLKQQREKESPGRGSCRPGSRVAGDSGGTEGCAREPGTEARGGGGSCWRTVRDSLRREQQDGGAGREALRPARLPPPSRDPAQPPGRGSLREAPGLPISPDLETVAQNARRFRPNEQQLDALGP